MQINQKEIIQIWKSVHIIENKFIEIIHSFRNSQENNIRKVKTYM